MFLFSVFDSLSSTTKISTLLFLALFSGVSLGTIGLNSPYPLSEILLGFIFLFSIKYLTILNALSVESSQLDLYAELFIGTLSVFPSATISLSVSCIIFAIVSRTCILLSFISALPESNNIDSSTWSTIPLSSSLILISSVREFFLLFHLTLQLNLHT